MSAESDRISIFVFKGRDQSGERFAALAGGVAPPQGALAISLFAARSGRLSENRIRHSGRAQ